MNVSVAAWLVVGAAFVAAATATALVLRLARAHGLLDHPGARSSHRVPVPTAGGIGIGIGIGVALLVSASLASIGHDWRLAIALALLLGALGYLDDRRGVGVLTRILCQGAAAGVVALLSLQMPLPCIALALPLAMLLLVALTNFFNFMDGIDGLAASQAVFIAAAGAWLASRGGAQADSVYLLAGIAGAAAGFLVFNRPPASIFMGDTGSLLLGFLLAAAALLSVLRDEVPAVAWLILWAVFLADCCLTLAARALRGERLYIAHREHAYQLLARGGGHRRVTLLVQAVNYFWLLPLAVLVREIPAAGPWAAALAYAPLVCGVLLIRRRHAGAVIGE